jgi:hypothetical protein
MARRISMATRSELVAAIGERYRWRCRREKRPILDEFVSVTGYHRVHAIRVLAMTSSWRDFHPQECAHAGRTMKKSRGFFFLVDCGDPIAGC